jgi:hypothetical protein
MVLWQKHLRMLPVAAPREVIIGRLEVEADEMWSFVQHKANKQWLWRAMDKQTRQIIAVRLAYIKLVIEAGATVKEAQTLVRHATPQMTLRGVWPHPGRTLAPGR